MESYSHLLKEILSIVRNAGAEALSFYNKDFLREQKEEFPVTEADLQINKILIDGLSKVEGFDIYSEEQKEDKDYLQQDKYFIIDPIDGTKDFVHKTDDFCIMLALIENKKPVIGVIYKPVSDEMFCAIKGEGAFVERKGKKEKLQVDSQKDFSKMKLIISKYHLKDTDIEIKDKLNIGDFQQKGSAGLKMCDIAQGVAHIYFNTASKTGEWDSAPGSLIVEEAGGKVTDTCGNPLEFGKEEPYNLNGFVISNDTRHSDIVDILQKITQGDNGQSTSNCGKVLWFIGLSGSGKSTIADELYKKLSEKGIKCERLDGDIMRKEVTSHLDFSKESRDKNIKMAGSFANKIAESGVVVIASFISAFEDQRQGLREMIGDKFVEIFVNTPIDICEQRDPKGLYKKARKGEIKDFTGISHPFEEPEKSDIVLNTEDLSAKESVEKIVDNLTKKGYFTILN